MFVLLVMVFPFPLSSPQFSPILSHSFQFFLPSYPLYSSCISLFSLCSPPVLHMIYFIITSCVPATLHCLLPICLLLSVVLVLSSPILPRFFSCSRPILLLVLLFPLCIFLLLPVFLLFYYALPCSFLLFILGSLLFSLVFQYFLSKLIYSYAPNVRVSRALYFSTSPYVFLLHFPVLPVLTLLFSVLYLLFTLMFFSFSLPLPDSLSSLLSVLRSALCSALRTHLCCPSKSLIRTATPMIQN